MKRRRVRVALMVLVAPLAMVIGTPQGAPVAAAGAVIFEDGFSGSALNTNAWQEVLGNPISPSKSQAYLIPGNVRVEDGLLKIATRRHCVTPGAKPSLANESRSRCGSGTAMRYSAGRVQSRFATPYGAAFEIRMSAQMPTNGHHGIRGALWARNSHPYCETVSAKTSLGELDLLEWHPDRVNRGESTTHMSCSGSLAEPVPQRWMTERTMSPSTFDDNGWYEWIVQREGNWVSYFVQPGGGSAIHIGSHICGQGEFGFSQARCDEILNDPYGLILQTDVFVHGGHAGHPGPEVNTFFDQQWLHIDWVRVSYLR